MPNPPKYFLRFFRWFCHPRLQKPIEGDLMELYEERFQELGKRKADQKFRLDVIQLFRPSIIKPADGTYRLNNYGMLKHNLLLIFRNFKKYKNSFLINLIGLSTGLASFMLIYLWVNDEVQKDKFHENKDRLYQVLRTLEYEDYPTYTAESNSVLLVPEMLAELAEIELAVPIMEEFSYAILAANEEKIKAVGKDFFNAFSFNLIQGSKDQVLVEKSSIVISQFLADKFFKNQNPIGQSFHMVDNTDGDVEYEGDYIVSGVFDIKELNSSEQFDFLLPHSLFEEGRDKPLKACYQALYASEERITVLSKYFAGIAIIISCLGLLALTSFSTQQRFKEIAIRKVLGSTSLSIVRLLSRDFSLLVSVAVIIGLPVAYYLMKNWLNNFAYRINLEPVYFLVSGILILAVAVLAIMIQIAKSTKFSVSESLRSNE
ncbi:MAG: permease prefix domain 2-containing transporter [Ekhidna sp.]